MNVGAYTRSAAVLIVVLLEEGIVTKKPIEVFPGVLFTIALEPIENLLMSQLSRL